MRVALTTHLGLRKCTAINLLRIWAFVFYSRAKFTFKQYKEREFWMCYTVRNWQEFSAVGRYLNSVMDLRSLNGSWPVTALWLVGDWWWWHYISLRCYIVQYRTTVRTKPKIYFIRLCGIWNVADIFNQQSGHFLLEFFIYKQIDGIHLCDQKLLTTC